MDNRECYIMDKEQLGNIIKECFEFKWMYDDKESWMKMENSQLNTVLVSYAYYFVDYQNTYYSAIQDDFSDCSIVIYNGGTPQAIWPLSVSKNGGGETGSYVLGTFGQELLPPFVEEAKYNEESLRKLYKKCIGMIRKISTFLNIKTCQVKFLVMNKGNSLFYRKIREELDCFVTDILTECFVNLSYDEQEILSKIRRTNKYSIQKAKDYWKIEIVTKNDDSNYIDECFEQFKKLHFEVAGRKTRSDYSWEKQRNAVKDTEDFLVMMREKSGKLIGASLYCCTKTTCMYAVGAYDRGCFDKPVTHLSQWEAIKYCKKLNKKWYYVGRRPYIGDASKPNEKELAIGHFKEGFATELYNSIIIRVNTL